MGWPLGSAVLANIFMCDFVKKWIRTSKNRPSVWFRYVDNFRLEFALFDDRKSASHVYNREFKINDATTATTPQNLHT